MDRCRQIDLAGFDLFEHVDQPGSIQARQVGQRLAEYEALDMAFLRLNGESIAFHCGSRAKGTSFGSKIGYDDRFAELSPGNALMHRLLRALHQEHGNWTHDFAGPLREWTTRFATRRYPVGRLIVAPGGAISRWLLRAYARRTTGSDWATQPAKHEESPSAAELQRS